MPERPTGVAAVDRAFVIVHAIALAQTPITLADLSRETGLYKSTLLRLIASLEKVSLVIRHPDGRYMLGPYAHKLGRAYQGTYHLNDVLQPILNDLVEQGSESSSFHVYNDPQTRMCLLRVNSHHSTLDRVDEGDLFPLERGAAGKLVDRFHDTNAVATVDNVTEISMGERDPDCAAVACAVFGPGNDFLGAISLSGPRERFTDTAVDQMLKMLRHAGRDATHKLGGQWPDPK